MRRLSRRASTPRSVLRRRVISTTAAAALAGLLASCSFLPDFSSIAGGGGGGGSASGSISIQPLFTRGDTGGVGSERITRSAADDGTFRLDFSEDEVGGLGESSRAASWNAAIISTLLTGQPLSGRFAFEITGAIDGPSAGALKTIALIALQNGDEIVETATMTGTINATGTIGPVGGIPEKIEGAAEEGIEKVLVPLGQRNTPNLAGEQVDVVRHGDRLGVEVIEVGDIYEAYEHLTGEALEAPTGGSEPRLGGRSYDKVEAQVTGAIGRYQAALAQYNGLAAVVRQMIDGTGIPAQAAESAAEAQDLNRQGLVAGAFIEAQNAAALMETVYSASNMLTPVFTQGFAGLDTVVAQAADQSATEAAFMAFIDQLGTFEAETVTDVEALVNAYGGAFDAYTVLDFSLQRVRSAADWLTQSGGAIDEADLAKVDRMFQELVFAVMYSQLAKAQIENSRAVFEVGRDNPSSPIVEEIDLRQVSDFFRRGADANYAAFSTSGTVASLADSNGLAADVVIGYIAAFDLDVALATQQQAVLPAIEEYIGPDKPNAAYAAMGYGLSNYVRNQMLVEKYYNNAILDANFEITGLMFEGSLNNAIDLSRDQVAAEIGILSEHDSVPVLTTAVYESAGLSQSGDVQERFTTLSGYSSGFVTARLLTYLGGWEASRVAS